MTEPPKIASKQSVLFCSLNIFEYGRGISVGFRGITQETAELSESSFVVVLVLGRFRWLLSLFFDHQTRTTTKDEDDWGMTIGGMTVKIAAKWFLSIGHR
jgi:hypothetical protein